VFEVPDLVNVFKWFLNLNIVKKLSKLTNSTFYLLFVSSIVQLKKLFDLKKEMLAEV
jgi:hypothetical protein